MERSTLLQKLNQPIYLKANKRKLAIFLREFSVLLSSGIKANTCIEILVRQAELKTLHHSLQKALQQVNQGMKLSDSFKKDKNFDSFFIAMISLGEETGRLPEIMKRLAVFYNREYELDKKIKNALIYPLILSITMIFVLAFLFQYVIPTFVSLFEGQEQVLPLSTRILLKITYFFKNYSLWIVLLLGGMILGFILAYQKPKVQYVIDGFKTKNILFGRHYKVIMAGRLSRALGIILNNGMPFLKGIQIVSKGIKDTYYRTNLDQIIKRIEAGSDITTAFKKHDITQDLFNAMLQVGEKTGELGSTLEEISDFYDQETNYSIDTMIKIFEPAMIIIMALVVGFIVVSIATPMFDLVNNFQM